VRAQYICTVHVGTVQKYCANPMRRHIMSRCSGYIEIM
jgi:hypothetical protein